MKERHSLVYEGVGYPLPFFATPSLLCLEPLCDCIDPLPPCAPEAALIVMELELQCFLLPVCPTGAWRDKEWEQAVETVLPWERKSGRPLWPLSYMLGIHIQGPPTSRMNSVYSHILTNIRKKDSNYSWPNYKQIVNLMGLTWQQI